MIASPTHMVRPALRRAIDLLVLLVIGLPAALLVCVLAVAVKVDSPGPVFVSHTRVGRGGTSFRLWKLRSMVENAEELKPSLAHLNVLPWPDFKIPDDPRVTRVGRWLRSTCLDELPQLYNLLRGDMTLVGPRPCSIALEKYELWHTERLEATPGIVGEWQARGRGTSSFDERCRMDIAQVRTTNPSRGALLVAKTLRSLVGPHGSA